MISILSSYAAPPRLAVVADGNYRDSDDICGTPVSLAIIKAYGYSDKLVHYSHSCDLVPGSGDPGGAYREAHMQTSCDGTEASWGDFPNVAKFYNCMREKSMTVGDLTTAIDASSASDPLWIIEAGEPDILYEAINGAQQDKRQYIYIVTHHPANDKGDNYDLTWVSGSSKPRIDQIPGFDSNKILRIPDQNTELKKPLSQWHWARDHADSRINWLWDRGELAQSSEMNYSYIVGDFDCSDAGMIYYWASERTESTPSVTQLRTLFEDYVGGTGKLIYKATTDFPSLNAGQVPFYVDTDRDALAIDAKTESYREKWARATATFEGRSDTYPVTISAMKETDGECIYRFLVNGSVAGTVTNDPTSVDYEIQNHVIENVAVQSNDTIAVESMALSNNQIVEGSGYAYARGRWTQLKFGRIAEPSGPKVTGLVLMNADTDTPVPGFNPMTHGATIDTAAIGTTNLNIIAQTDPDNDFGSVRFELTGATTHTQNENVYIWALFGDTSGVVNNGNFNNGLHTLKVTPYPGDGQTGDAGTALTISFTVTDDGSGPLTVALSSPTEGTTIEPGQSLSLQTYISSPNAVTQVEFFEGSNSLGTDTSYPFTYTWGSIPEGEYSLTAVATTTNSTTVTSAAVHVSATPPPSFDDAWVESNGLIVFDAETATSLPSQWREESSIAGAHGDAYLRCYQDNFNTPGNGIVTYPIAVTTSGRYQLQWRSYIGTGSDSTEHNDTWARMGDGDGNGMAPVDNENDMIGTWAKIYMNTASAWDWRSANVDRVGRSLSWNLEAGKVYNFQISARSAGHCIDRIVLWDHARHNLASKTSGTNPDASALDAQEHSSWGGGGESLRVTLISPANGATVESGETVTVAANVTDAGKTITQVEFFAGSSSIGVDTTNPYSIEWIGVPTGTHNISATVTASDTSTATATPVSLNVLGPQVTTLTDTYVRNGAHADNNYGSATNLAIKADATYPDYHRESLLQIAFPSNLADSSVRSATLRLNVQENGGAGAHSLYEASSDSWTADTVTFNTKPTAGTLITSATPPAVGEWLELNITDSVEAALEGDMKLSMLITSADSALVNYHSIDETDESVRPQLIVDYNNKPHFAGTTINGGTAYQDEAYSGQLTATDDDGDAITFTKTSGPGWLDVAADGTLSGTPNEGTGGMNVFTVQVEDTIGGTDTATLNIQVIGTSFGVEFISAEGYNNGGLSAHADWSCNKTTAVADTAGSGHADLFTLGYERSVFQKGLPSDLVSYSSSIIFTFDELSSTAGMPILYAALYAQADADGTERTRATFNRTASGYNVRFEAIWADPNGFDTPSASRAAVGMNDAGNDTTDQLKLTSTMTRGATVNDWTVNIKLFNLTVDPNQTNALINHTVSGITHTNLFNASTIYGGWGGGQSDGAGSFTNRRIHRFDFFGKRTALTGFAKYASEMGLAQGASGDDDGDGISNLKEYALGGNAQDADIRIVQPRLQLNGDGTVDFFHMKRIEDSDITYNVHWTTNLLGGLWNSNWLEEANAPASDQDFQENRMQVDGLNKDSVFFRLKVLLQ